MTEPVGKQNYVPMGWGEKAAWIGLERFGFGFLFEWARGVSLILRIQTGFAGECRCWMAANSKAKQSGLMRILVVTLALPREEQH
jgi:hypothetical protein